MAVDPLARLMASPGALTSFSKRGYPAIQRLINQALLVSRQATNPINGVMASPPTVTQGGIGVASTVNGNAVSTASALASNPKCVLPLGGPFLTLSGNNVRPQTRTNGNVAGRTAGHRSGMAFVTFAHTVGIVAGRTGSAAAYWMTCVTDLITGVRARVQASDWQTLTSDGSSAFETKLVFGSGTDADRRPRLYESCAYNGLAFYVGVNVPSTDAVFAPNAALDRSSCLFIWDSWGDGVTNPLTNPAALSVPDYIAAGLGIMNPFCASVGSTGFVANNGGVSLNYQGRLALGDADVSRIGYKVLSIMPASINDVGAGTAAQLRAAIPGALAALRVAQPDTVIIGWGPQNATSTTPDQTYFDAAAGGYADYIAATGDPNVIYIDNSPTGENWIPTAIKSTIYTGTNAHVNDIGVQYYGSTAANSVLAALIAKYA